MQITKCGLSEHEIQTLARTYAAKLEPPGTDLQTLQYVHLFSRYDSLHMAVLLNIQLFLFNCLNCRAIVQTELRRFNFDKILLSKIEYTLRYHDPCRTGNDSMMNANARFMQN